MSTTASPTVPAIPSVEAFTQTLQQNPVTVVDFWAPWCGPCQAYGPVVETVAADTPDHIRFVKVNVDEVPELARTYGIQSIPTTLIFRDGELVDRANGMLSARDLKTRAESA